MDSKGDGRHFWNVLFSGRLGPVYMVVCCSAGGWFGRFRGQWFGRFLRQLQLFFMDSKGDGKHSVLALRRLVWTLSWPVVWTLSRPVTVVFYGFQRWREAFLKRCFSVVLALCIWWFAVAQVDGLDAFMASGLDAFVFYGFQRWREAFLKRSVFRSSWPCVYGGLL